MANKKAKKGESPFHLQTVCCVPHHSAGLRYCNQNKRALSDMMIVVLLWMSNRDQVLILTSSMKKSGPVFPAAHATYPRCIKGPCYNMIHQIIMKQRMRKESQQCQATITSPYLRNHIDCPKLGNRCVHSQIPVDTTLLCGEYRLLGI